MLKSRLSAFLSLLVVFISGAVVGGLVYRAYNPPPTIQRPPKPEDIKKHIIADMQKSINLDDQQVAQVGQIMDEIRTMSDEVDSRRGQEFRKIRDVQVEKIKKVLRPDQEPLYDKWLQEREAARQRRRAQQGFKDNRK